MSYLLLMQYYCFPSLLIHGIGGAQVEGSERLRVIQEYVPGKQVTLAHIIRNPKGDLCQKVGIDRAGAIGIMTITPGEGAIIAADIASKSSAVNVEFVDRFTGCVILTGEVASVENALSTAVNSLKDALGFFPAEVTFT
ncbi:BMC domain protein [Acetomicrobium hydrogeniformans ATCC BAA-1850]|uniref:BMC domain protein n=1 Tax=Acetomicrobium hydrogeniformans ATCC BAA-1850 TaxID=592015 RepID=A0A0T5XAR2_9BACT|nr:BMC domain protein [Acetomicrobium hydrogeniformans ATCC BAA-1850]